MARRSRTTMLKRLREAKKAEKAAQKRARRHGGVAPGARPEPKPTVDIGALMRGEDGSAEDDDQDAQDVQEAEDES